MVLKTILLMNRSRRVLNAIGMGANKIRDVTVKTFLENSEEISALYLALPS
jgi:hypothetical protein